MDVAPPLAEVIAEQRLRIVAGLIRVTGDWDLAEDCLQDAVERALTRWPRDGIPDNPAAWLTTTAHRRALDVLRRRRTEVDKLQAMTAMAQLEPPADTPFDQSDDVYRDDRLRLLFTCCHPALPLTGRVALTLKTVAGLSTREVARAFLVSEATMGQRLLRTRAKIANAGISFRVPAPHRLAERTAGVLAVVYLVFNEGYAGTEGEATRDDLAAEAVRLTGLVARLLPADDEVHGLRALLLLQHARRVTRTDSAGDLVPMEEQDRSRWDSAMLSAGLASLTLARATGRPPRSYRLQAEIAAEHATAPHAAATDWARVVTGYDALLRVQPSPVVALNRAVALGFRDGPDAGLHALAGVEEDKRLAGYHLRPAARADLLRRAGRGAEAIAAYQEALGLVHTAAERRFVQRRMREIDGGS
ncbi:MAG: sigma-70 family RNA polymerase sigma factor [Geodermatophilaceae bacterium]|nr:sigma-70 family RNA polymerase sigma factor [Geodermatophilaceae bacterium]